MSGDSVGVEIATVSLPLSSDFDEIESALDEQIMDPVRRRGLAINGLRTGCLGTQVPTSILLLLAAAAEDRLHPTADSMNRGQEVERYVHCRAGRSYDVPISKTMAELSFLHFDGDTTLRQKYSDAQAIVSVRCTPHGSSGVTLEFTPELEHGKLRQKWVAEDGTFRLETKRDRIAYEDLKMSVSLRPGETALVTCWPDMPESIGHGLFKHAETRQQRLLLVRLAQTQTDNLFQRQGAGEVDPMN